MLKKVYVTGMGLVSAAGMNPDEVWQAVNNGESGIRPVNAWSQSDVFTGGELKDYQPRKMVPDPKWLKLISRQDVIGLNAVFQAIDHSQCVTYRDSLEPEAQAVFNENMGLYIGSSGNKFFQQYDFMPLMAASKGKMPAFAEKLFETVHPMWLLKILPNNVLAYAGIQHGFKGPNQNIVNHAASGLQAVIEAYWAIATGQTERAVAAAYDVGFEPQGQAYYEALGVISPTGMIRSFDMKRDGTVLGEGAAALVLESEAAVKERNARVYAEILGGQQRSEACGIFGLEPSGKSLEHLIQSGLERLQLKAGDIGMITAHANGNMQSDHSEAQALSALFGRYHTPVTGFKWSVSHTLCAAGVIDTVLTILALNHQKVPGIPTLTDLADECQGISVSSLPQKTLSSIGLVVARGFGGMDTSLFLKAAHG